MRNEVDRVQDIDGTDEPFMCSFCLRPREETGVLVGAPNVGICRQCVDAAVVLLRQPAPESDLLPRAPWDAFTDDELLRQLPKVAQARDDVEEHLRKWVGAARLRHLSWASIGESLGMSRQSAWERFRQSPMVQGDQVHQ